MQSVPAVGDPELVIHLFAPTAGPDRDRAYRQLLRIWAACRDLMRMDRPLPSDKLDAVVPLEPPPSPPPADETEVVLAGQQRDSREVLQALLRRRHDVLCLSVVLTSHPDVLGDWADLDRQWDAIAGTAPPTLLGTARIYQACLLDPSIGLPEASAAHATRYAAGLAHGGVTGWEKYGTMSGDGFAIWDLGGDDMRLERRLVVIASKDDDRRLSAWTWSDGRLSLPPFARYLLQAAKVRFELRVRTGADPRALSDRSDAVARRLGMLLVNAGEPRPANESSKVGAASDRLDTVLGQLRRQEIRLVEAAASLREMRRTVEIAADNMAAVLGVADARGDRGLFGEDQQVAAWFVRQLDDDLFYLEAARDRARETDRLVEREVDRLRRAAPPRQADAVDLGASRRQPAGEPMADIELSADDWVAFARVLATIFGTGPAADQLLERIGYARSRRPSVGSEGAETVWHEILRDLTHGAVARPISRLLLAALDQYPHNDTFVRLSMTYGDCGWLNENN